MIRYEDGSQELYHLKTDPDARVNRIAELQLSGVVRFFSQFIPRDPDFLYGGPGSDQYEIGGGEVFVFETVAPSTETDVDQLFISGTSEEVEFSQVDWNGNTKTLRIDHPGGSVLVYDHFSAATRVEILRLRDGYYDFRDEKFGDFTAGPFTP